MHYYKFNISNWYLNTAHLSLEEEAVYFRLINHYYDSEQPIPVDTQSVIRRLRLGFYSDIVGIVLKEFFNLEDDGWHHKTCDELINEYHANAEKNRKNGKSGGRPSKNKNLEDNPKITQSVTTNNPMVTLTNNYKLKTNIHTPEGVDDFIFKEYLNNRKKLKKSWTERVEKRLRNEGDKLGWNLQKVIEYCLEKEWVNFEADWVKDKKAKNNSLDIFEQMRVK